MTKFLVQKVNRGTIIDMSWWYKTWQRMDTIPPLWNKNFPGNPEEPHEVPGSDEETKSHLHRQFLGTWQVLRGIILESCYVNATQIRNTWDCWKSSAQSEWKDICGAAAVRSGLRMVGRFYGMLYRSAKRSRSVVWWWDTIWKANRNTIQLSGCSDWSDGRMSPYLW